MPNIGQAFKAEVTRISRKEIKPFTKSLHRSTVILKKDVADLKRRLASVEADNKRLLAFYKAAEKNDSSVAPETAQKVRISSTGILKLRNKLNLSQNEFAKLLGISTQAVHTMEHKNGRVRMRSATLARFLSARTWGKREAKRRLEEIGE